MKQYFPMSVSWRWRCKLALYLALQRLELRWAAFKRRRAASRRPISQQLEFPQLVGVFRKH